jgi:Arc/MetJ-type ribon-helix-helix transcriptional regulator
MDATLYFTGVVMTKYRYVNLPSNLVEQIEKIIRERGIYNSIADFVAEAVRLRLEALGAIETVKESEAQ